MKKKQRLYLVSRNTSSSFIRLATVVNVQPKYAILLWKHNTTEHALLQLFVFTTFLLWHATCIIINGYLYVHALWLLLFIRLAW